MAFGEFLFGTPAKTQQFNRFTPQQMGFQNQLGQQASQGLSSTNLDYSPIRQQIMNQFETKTIPGLLERLQGFQGAGTQRSGALGGQLGGALQNLGGQLASGESQYNLQKYNTLLNALGVGLQPQFETAQFGAQPGLLQGLAGGLGQGFGNAIPLSFLLSQYGGQQNNADPVSLLMQLLGNK